LSNNYIVSTIIIGIGTFIGSFFSYLLQFLLGRFLSVSNYGTFTALLSLSNLLGVFASVFAVSVVKRVAEYTAKNNRSMTTRMFKSLSFISIVIGAVAFLLIMVFSSGISSSLQINDRNIVIIFAVSIGLSFLGVIPMSFLQGSMLYKRWAFFGSLSSFLRMLMGAVPAVIGLGLYYVFAGLSLSTVICYLISIFLLQRIFLAGKSLDLGPEYKKLLFFGFSTLLITLGLTFINNVDMVMVKRYFDPETAGYFAGAITVGKILLFGSTAVATLMFPSITALYAQGKNFVPQFKQLVVIQSFLLGVGFLIFELFPKTVTILFFGQTFVQSVPYLRLFSVFIAVYVFVYFLVLFLLAIEKTKVYLLLIPGMLLQFFLINNFHASVFQIIYADIVTAGLTLALLVAYLIFVVRKNRFN
jgi:O-antigen/teichoic acid export membrane protein